MRQRFNFVLQVSAIILAVAFPWRTATAQDATSSSLEEQLRTQFKLATIVSDSNGPKVLEPGLVLVIKRAGILGVPYANVAAAKQTFKEGALSDVSKIARAVLGKNTRYLDVGEKVYVRKLDVNAKNNNVTFVVVECDSCNGATEPSSYRAEVVFEFPKGSYVSRSAIQASISEVFAVDASSPTPGRQADLPPHAPDVTSLKVPGTYVSAQSPTDQLQLNADNSLSLNAGGQTSGGTYVRNGNTLRITISDTGVETTMTAQGSSLADASGQIWTLREQAATTTPGGPALRNDDIIKLVKVGIDDATIITKIGSSKCEFDTSTDALVQLKQSGVSAPVLKAMVGARK